MNQLRSSIDRLRDETITHTTQLRTELHGLQETLRKEITTLHELIHHNRT